MKSTGLAKHYDKLTPGERFRLIMAAGSRGDETEGDRLMNTGQCIHLSFPDHAPYAHALQELLLLTYIELLEDAALFQECNALTDSQLRDSIEATSAPKRTKKRTKDREPVGEVVDYPAWHRTGRTAYGVGFLFKVKVQGWKLFCTRQNVAPLALWEQMRLPGLDRLKRAMALAVGGNSFPSAAEMVRWMNEVRPAGDPERTEADILTAKSYAAGLDTAFRNRVRWWKGC